MSISDLEKITEDTKMWSPLLDLDLPIDGSLIPEFSAWINWSGWKGYDIDHTAFDFAAYLTKDKKIILGLPEETPIYAVADGVIKTISGGFGWPYYCSMEIEHGKINGGMFSSYTHIVPITKQGQKVKKGEVIATLYKDSANECEKHIPKGSGRLVHLHFELHHAWSIIGRYCNPEVIFPLLTKYKTVPQFSTTFKVPELTEQPEIHIAHFKSLYFDSGYLTK